MKKLFAVLLLICICLAVSACSNYALKTDNTQYSDEAILTKIDEYCKQYGISIEEVKKDTDIWKKLVDDVIFEYATPHIANAKAEEMGLLPLTQSEEIAVNTVYTNMLSSIDAMLYSNMPKLTESELKEEREKYIADLGYNMQTFMQLAKTKVIMRKIADTLGKEIIISEDELKKEHEYLAQKQKDYFEANPNKVTEELNNADIVNYIPKEVIHVKMLTLPFLPEIRGKVAILLNDGKIEEAEILFKQAENENSKAISDLRNYINDGHTLEEASEKFNLESIKTQYVYLSDPQITSSFKTAVEKLKTDKFSETNLYNGHIFLTSDLITNEGIQPLELVKSTLQKKMTEQKKLESYNLTMQKWFDEAKSSGFILIDNSRIVR